MSMAGHVISRVRFRKSRGGTGSLLSLIGRKVSDYDVHQLVWSLFGSLAGEQARDFVFRMDGEGLDSYFTVVSARPPVDDHGIFDIETKPFAPVIELGRMLRFTTRVNPSVSVNRTANGKTRTVRADPVGRHLAALKEHGVAFYEEDERRNALTTWLDGAGERSGFARIESDLVAYNSVKHPKNTLTNMPVAEFRGVLEVRDAALFEQALVSGIGRGRAFGYGMLQVAR